MRKKILCSAAVFLFLSIVLSFWIVNASGKKLSFTRISQEEAKEMMEKDDGHVILDVRTEEEYASGHIPGAVCIPNETIYKDRPEQLPDLNQIILVYCRSGNRSKRSARMLYEMGYTNVYEFGGINDWTGETETSETREDAVKTIYLAGGCFWGVQKYFDQFDGVESTEVGYANGPGKAPSYQEVCSSSGHAETVKINYDEKRITLTELLDYYFMVIDPYAVNQQGNDKGIQYRTGIYYADEDQLAEIEAVYSAMEAKGGRPLAVELEPIKNFYSAEEYHQKYLDKNPGGYCHIPKSMLSLGE